MALYATLDAARPGPILVWSMWNRILLNLRAASPVGGANGTTHLAGSLGDGAFCTGERMGRRGRLHSVRLGPGYQERSLKAVHSV